MTEVFNDIEDKINNHPFLSNKTENEKKSILFNARIELGFYAEWEEYKDYFDGLEAEELIVKECLVKKETDKLADELADELIFQEFLNNEELEMSGKKLRNMNFNVKEESKKEKEVNLTVRKNYPVNYNEKHNL